MKKPTKEDNMIYRTDLGIDKDQSFGVEIEFTNAKLSEIQKQSEIDHLPIQYMYHHYHSKHLPYDVWYLDEDVTVSQEQFGKLGIKRFIGGELSSKIMHDIPCDWLELQQICHMLQSLHAKISSNCSNHITVDTSKVRNQKVMYETLAQILAIYEPEIYSFYMGDGYLERATMDNYAKLIRPRLLTEQKSQNFLETLDRNEHPRYLPFVFTNLDAINIRGKKHPNQVEFRYPNGTLSEKTIQNNINFTVKLLDAINHGRFKRYRLNHQVSKVLSKYATAYEEDLYDQSPRDNYFDQLVDIIATSDADQQDFHRQYQKVKNTRHKI